jgi:hypothetical protein
MRAWLPILLAPLSVLLTYPVNIATGPRITLTKDRHDFGTIPLGADGHCTFTFINTGDAPLIIHQFQSSCGCLVPFWSQLPVMPGDTGSVGLRYDTRRPGPFRKSATLISNDPERPRIVLGIAGEVLSADTYGHPHAPAR